MVKEATAAEEGHGGSKGDAEGGEGSDDKSESASCGGGGYGGGGSEGGKEEARVTPREVKVATINRRALRAEEVGTEVEVAEEARREQG